jgi:hypothetical protein
MNLKPGDRVRCIDAAASAGDLVQGGEYFIADVDGAFFWLLPRGGGPWRGPWRQSRFKPVVRVKAWRRRVRFTELGIAVISELGGGKFYDEWLDRAPNIFLARHKPERFSL